jgi:hypothetical protein
MQHLLKNLQRLDMSYLSTKNINQDPAEIFFFCQIRQHGGRNTNPTVLKHYLSITLLEGTQ